ncbi:MAG: hypothetical protein V7767_03365 [Leeuwenhoekiella sp.]
MKVFGLIFLFSCCLIFPSLKAQNLSNSTNFQEVSVSAIKGDSSRTGKIIFRSAKKLKKVSASIKGDNAALFKITSKIPEVVGKNDSIVIDISFYPKEFLGVAEAELVLNSEENKIHSFTVRGLSTKGLEGGKEPPFEKVLQALGFKTEIGWTTLSNHTRSELQGEELPQTLFKKANTGDVEMNAVARYSPKFALPFGYFVTEDSGNPVLKEVGVLANTKDYPEHQTLYPTLERGSTSFDPKDQSFGFYTTGPTHTAYSIDRMNILLSKKFVAHACRIFPVRDSAGVILPNQYLVCFEEAQNGDYQDYVFVVKNIEPVSASDSDKN